MQALEFAGAFGLVDGHHPGALLGAEIRRAAPAPSQAQDEDAVPVRDDVFLVHDPQRSLREDRATNPRMIETIQKRTTIFCSGQPSFS